MSEKIYYLKNKVQEYEWGSKTMMSAFVDNPDGKNLAELWIGVHPKAPSIVSENGKEVTLDQLIQADPDFMLGRNAAKFQNKLPFLMKLLAVENPLSVQAHPNKEQAQAGFARENGLPLDSPERNYRDANQKPETICALSDFTLLCGFRKPGEIYDLFKMTVHRNLKEEIELLKKRNIKDFFRALLDFDKVRRKVLLSEFTASASSRIGMQDEAFPLSMELIEKYPGDVTALMPLMLNLIKLKPGMALNIPTGCLHTYINGLGIEVMANSDNVVRAGLTPKHIDLQELMNIAVFEPNTAIPYKPERNSDGLAVYETGASEFALAEIEVGQTPFVSAKERGADILLCVDGSLQITFGESPPRDIKQGESVIAPSGAGSYRLSGKASVFRASLVTTDL